MITEKTTHFPCFNVCAIIFNPVFLGIRLHMSVCKVALTSCDPNQKNIIQTLQSWPRDNTVASVKPSVRLPGWAAIGRCCLYNINVGADAVTLLAIWNTVVIFEKSQEWCLFFKLCPDMHTISTRFPFDDKPLTESTMVQCHLKHGQHASWHWITIH